MTAREIMQLLLELDDTCRKERTTRCKYPMVRDGGCVGDNHEEDCPLDSLRNDRLALSQKLDGAL